MSNPPPLRFGIPTLDRLLGDNSEDRARPDFNYFGFKQPTEAVSSVCLIGPHGTGKSILALHFASRYFADCLSQGADCKVFYVSTDLSKAMALNVWESFSLDLPRNRKIPFGSRYSTDDPLEEENQPLVRVSLIPTNPYAEESEAARLTQPTAGEAEDNEAKDKEEPSLAAVLTGKNAGPEITFVDLAATSAGDDWGFIHRLIAVLDEPQKQRPRHLVVVDAVEGLETLVGEKDAFGEVTSRRSRIAQMLRTAADKCHLFFVVEEPAEGMRVPEEFVSDVVIRLRNVYERGYSRRTVEVQKVRGQDHIRGQHPYVIRRGVGSSTGSQENVDDPVVKQPEEATDRVEAKQGRPEFQAYVHVMPSFHHLTRDIMLVPGGSRPDPNRQVAAFGITYLDGMLGWEGSERGLPCSTVSALIGDAGTHKSALGRAFLYRGLYNEIVAEPNESKSADNVDNVAILLTTRDIDAEGLARQFLRWACNDAKTPQNSWLKSLRSDIASESPQGKLKIQELCERNVICRRLEIHSQTSEILMHMVRQAILQAQKNIGLKPEQLSSAERYVKSWKIRLVIDNFSILRNTYATVRDDSLFLPFLIFHLKREGVSTLMIDTNPGRPDRDGPAFVSDELRAMVDHHLYTWRLGFHGESRIAISAIPPIGPDQRSRVRELLWDPHRDFPPTVDRSLELYTGLEQANPRPVPVEVRLYAETDSFCEYIEEMNRILGDFFVPVPATHENPSPALVVGIKPNEYAYLHDFCNLQAKHRLDHTLILAVDEFWAVNPPEHAGPEGEIPRPLRKETDYLQASLDVFANEPRQLFQGQRAHLPTETIPFQGGKEKVSRGHRYHYFHVPAYSLVKTDQSGNPEQANVAADQIPPLEQIDRVPFAWDFGFLLCRKTAWTTAHNDEVWVGRNPKTVGQILSALPSTEGELHNWWEEHPVKNDRKSRPGWREFLGACQAVSARTGGLPFDISTLSEESFSCLLLEMWASQTFDRLASPDRQEDYWRTLTTKAWETPVQRGCGLREWLEVFENKIDLYMAWLLLVDLLPLSELANPGRPTTLIEHSASPVAAASRQWYKGACQLLRRPECEPMLAVGLPGHFSTRGDWFLGVAHGSRSYLLADRVLDIFSSRRNNLTRLYSGIGLPTRILGSANSDYRRMTALTWKDSSGESRSVRYGPLLSLGAAEAPTQRLDDFHWLFRSALRNYHRHARIFQRWNSRTILMWNQTKAEAGANWVNGFAVYDRLVELSKQKHKGKLKGWPTTDAEMEERTAEALKYLTDPRRRNRHDADPAGSADSADSAGTNETSWHHFNRRCGTLRELLRSSDETGPLWENPQDEGSPADGAAPPAKGAKKAVAGS